MKEGSRSVGRLMALTWLVALVPILGAADEARVKAELAATAVVGQRETLLVRLVASNDTPWPAARPLEVKLFVEGHRRGLRWTLPKGQSEIAFRLTGHAPAAYTLRIVVEGFDPVWVPWIIAPRGVAPAPTGGTNPRLVRQIEAPITFESAEFEEKGARTFTRPGRAGELHALRREIGERPGEHAGQEPILSLPMALATQSERLVWSPQHVPLSGGVPDSFGAADPVPFSRPQGILTFHADRLAVSPGSDGRYRRPLFATWMVDGVARTPSVPISAAVAVVEDTADVQVLPERLVVPATSDTGQVQLQGSVSGRAVLRLLDRADGDQIVIDFLPPRPSGVVFALDQPTSMRRLGPGKVEVCAHLVDRFGVLVAAGSEISVHFTARSRATSVGCTAKVPAGGHEATCILTLARFGKYVLSARTTGIEKVAEVPFTFRLDWALLAWMFAGALVGATVQLLRLGARHGKPLYVRRYVIGAVAALVVALLVVYGGLALIEWNLPEGLGEAVRGSNQLAFFLVGLLGGVAGESVFVRLDRRLFRPDSASPAASGGQKVSDRASKAA